jgi:drug/metabolite transporter (DMT)-like permease
MLFFGSLGWSESDHQELLSPMIALLVLYVGCATAAVFILRCRSLQSLSPAIVGTYHNFIPVCTALLAYLCLGEPIGSATIFGGMMVIAGAEMVRRPQILFWRFLPWTKTSLSSLKSSKNPS